MAPMDSPYDRLAARSRQVTMIHKIDAVLGWDQQTYMPPGAAAYRAEQDAWLAGSAHRLFVGHEVGEWIAACEDLGLPDTGVEAANVREWRRTYDRARCLPQELVEAFSRETALAHEAWVGARARGEFSLFLPHLERVLELAKRMAECYGHSGHPLDALIENYERGWTAAEIARLFESLAPELAALVQEGAARQAHPEPLPPGPYPVEVQRRFNRAVAEAFGFDFDRGRIDAAAHPFCTDLGPGDVRLTTRYDTEDFTHSLYCVLHEVGHGLYEQGLLPEHHGTPAGESVSLGIHESQSRLWENHVGRAESFWRAWHAEAVRHFPQLGRVAPDALARHVNRIHASFIRVDASEVAYDLHIVLRFRMELALLDGSLAAVDLPAAWNEEFARLFGMRVPDDARGCLQDVHWSGGAFGYFPTYTLGNLIAAQFFAAARERLPGLEADLEARRYGGLLGWLRDHVHRHGSTHPPTAIVLGATGAQTRPAAHLAHLRQKAGI